MVLAGAGARGGLDTALDRETILLDNALGGKTHQKQGKRREIGGFLYQWGAVFQSWFSE